VSITSKIKEYIPSEQKIKKCSEGSVFNVIGACSDFRYNYKKYLNCYCRVCLSNSNILASKLYDDSAICKRCFNTKLENEAKLQGLTLIGDAINNRSRKYRFNECGHIRDIETSSVRCGSFTCVDCFNINLNMVAKEYGLTIIENLGKTYRKCLIDKCGHAIELQIGHLKKGVFECRSCKTIEYSNFAKNAGLEYVGKTDIKDRHLYRATCGHSFIKQLGHIKRGMWSCPICDNSAYNTKTSYIYLFQIDVGSFSFLKMGYSIEPLTRKSKYGLIDGSVATNLISVELPTGKIAHEIERRLHSKFKHFKYSVENIKHLIQESGFTECYPIEMKAQLLLELEQLEHRRINEG
jgi:hypothetical protein